MSFLKEFLLQSTLMLGILAVLLFAMLVVIHITGIDMPVRIVFCVVAFLIYRKIIQKI